MARLGLPDWTLTGTNWSWRTASRGTIVILSAESTWLGKTMSLTPRGGVLRNADDQVLCTSSVMTVARSTRR